MTKKTIRSLGTEVNAPAPYKMSAEDKRRQMKYAAEDDVVLSVTRADEIKKDKTLISHVKRHAREQVKTMQKVCK